MSESVSRFEELVSLYIDGALSPEQEYELLQMLESPANAQAFTEMLQINSEMTGLLSTPVADQKMAELVGKEIGASKRESRVCNAIMDAIHREPARVDEVAFARQTPLITKPTTPWAIVISVGLHAALIALIVGMHFVLRVNPATVVENPEEITKPSSPLPRIDSLNGDVRSIQNAEKHQARTGVDLAAGEALETMGAKSSADLRFTDGTVLMLSTNTRVRQAPEEKKGPGLQVASGKKVFLERGTLNAQVAKQPEGLPMTLVTPNAEATIIGTRFVLSSESNETRLEVSEGIVKLTRLFDHKSVMVQAGEYAVVTPGVELTVNSSRKSGRFVMGVNFYGKPVTIEGNAWMSQSEAEQRGLIVQVGPETVNSHIMNVTPVPAVDNQVRAMLNSRAYSMSGDMAITQPLPPGEYDVYLWLFEPATQYSRAFDIEVNGTMMERGAGKYKLGAWKKAGPYRGRSEDGKITVRLKKVQGNPAISGMAIFAVDSSGN